MPRCCCWNAAEHCDTLKKVNVSGGQFRRVWPIFGEKIVDFLANQCWDSLLA
jgi:hypothetical protein